MRRAARSSSRLLLTGCRRNEILTLRWEDNDRAAGELDVVLEWWKEEKAKRRGPVPRDRIEQEVCKHAPTHGQLEPYRQVAVRRPQQGLARIP